MTKEDSCIVDFDLIETANSKKVYRIDCEEWAKPGIDNVAGDITKLYKYLELRQEMAKKSIDAIRQSGFIYLPKLRQHNIKEILNYFNRPSI
jgi:hypothetical protein